MIDTNLTRKIFFVRNVRVSAHQTRLTDLLTGWKVGEQRRDGMRKIIIIGFLLVGCRGDFKVSNLLGGDQCLSPDTKVSQGTVLCCCNTYNGQCCKNVTYCSGFVPGCACSGKSEAITPVIP